MINFVIENDWKWNHCRLPIKRSEKHSKRRDEQYFYQVINSQDTGAIKEEKIKIALDRQFPFEQETGFVWHKSWNLPQVSISLGQQERQVLSQLYKDIKCEVMAVYPIKYSNSYYLNEVTLEGTCVKPLHENPTVFKFLKFAETSFNHNRNKFCLLAWVFGENIYKEKDDLFCLISSPIYVDSRKEARKKDSNSISNSVVYSPNKFTASIKGIKGVISNSAEGFISYYGAQNIRNKIKHPFYVTYHFDRIFKLYLNTEAKVTLVEALALIENAKATENQLAEKNLILLQITDSNEKSKKKILSMIEKWRFGLIEYVCQNSQMNSTKWIIVTKENIKSAYKQHYQNQLLQQQQNGLAKREDNQLNNEQDMIEENRNYYNEEELNICDIQGEKEKQREIEKDKEKEKEKQSERYELRTIIDLSRPKKRVKIQREEEEINN